MCGRGGEAGAGSKRWKLAAGRRGVEFSESERCVGEEEEVFGEISTKGKAVVTKR